MASFGSFQGCMGNSYEGRKNVWVGLGSIKRMWKDPWCLGGDFNMIIFPREMRNCSRLSFAMRRFSEIIEDLNFRELQLSKG